MIQYPLGVGGHTTRVLESGSGDEVLLLVHGVGARADRWRPNLLGLGAAGYRVVAIDLPGHGLAVKGGDLPYSVPFFADFLLGTLDALGIGRVTLVGTSLGAHIVAEAACRAPDRVLSLVMVGALGLVSRPGLTPPMARSLRATSREAVHDKLLRVCGDPSLVSEEWVTEEWRIANSPGAKEALDLLAAYMDSGQDADTLGERLRALGPDLETLLVWGEDDQSVPVEVGRAALELLPGSRLVVMRGAGHGPYYERPEVFNGLVASFLAGTLGPERTRVV